MLSLKHLFSLRTERNLVVIALVFFIEVPFSVCSNCSIVSSNRESLKSLCFVKEICNSAVGSTSFVIEFACFWKLKTRSKLSGPRMVVELFSSKALITAHMITPKEERF